MTIGRREVDRAAFAMETSAEASSRLQNRSLTRRKIDASNNYGLRALIGVADIYPAMLQRRSNSDVDPDMKLQSILFLFPALIFRRLVNACFIVRGSKSIGPLVFKLVDLREFITARFSMLVRSPAFPVFSFTRARSRSGLLMTRAEKPMYFWA